MSRPLEDIVVENGDVKARSSLELELTADERRAIDLVEELASLLGRVVAHGTTRERDLATLHDKLRDIERAVMSQALARAHPDRFSPLGK